MYLQIKLKQGVGHLWDTYLPLCVMRSSFQPLDKNETLSRYHSKHLLLLLTIFITFMQLSVVCMMFNVAGPSLKGNINNMIGRGSQLNSIDFGPCPITLLS